MPLGLAFGDVERIAEGTENLGAGYDPLVLQIDKCIVRNLHDYGPLVARIFGS